MVNGLAADARIVGQNDGLDGRTELGESDLCCVYAPWKPSSQDLRVIANSYARGYAEGAEVARQIEEQSQMEESEEMDDIEGKAA